MALDLDRIKIEGIVFKKGKDDSVKQEATPYSYYAPRKQKGKTISGSAKMKAEYKARKKRRQG